MESYLKVGMYHEELVSLTKKGKSGFEEIQNMIHEFRTNSPKDIAGIKVQKIDDYEKQTSLYNDGTSLELAYPKSNVIIFTLADGSRIAIRPSGTEPKIKFYFSVNTKLEQVKNYDQTKKTLATNCKKLIQSIGI